MPIHTEEHITAIIDRATQIAVHRLENNITKARDRKYAVDTLTSNLKFDYVRHFPQESLNEFIASQLNHAYLMGWSLRQSVKELPSQVEFIEELTSELIQLGGSELLNDSEESFKRCVKLFIRYRCFLNVHDFIVKTYQSDVKLSGKTSQKQPELKALVSRSKSDGKTRLPMEATLTLFKLLKEYKFTLKDEYMNNKTLSEATHALTGYSKHKLRQYLSDPMYYSLPLKRVLRELKFLTNKIEEKLEHNTQGDVTFGDIAHNVKARQRGPRRGHDPNSTVN